MLGQPEARNLFRKDILGFIQNICSSAHHANLGPVIYSQLNYLRSWLKLIDKAHEIAFNSIDTYTTLKMSCTDTYFYLMHAAARTRAVK